MTQLADIEATEELHHRENNRIAVSLLSEPPQHEAAACVDRTGMAR